MNAREMNFLIHSVPSWIQGKPQGNGPQGYIRSPLSPWECLLLLPPQTKGWAWWTWGHLQAAFRRSVGVSRAWWISLPFHKGIHTLFLTKQVLSSWGVMWFCRKIESSLPVKALFSRLMFEKYDLLMEGIHYERCVMRTTKKRMKLFPNKSWEE